MELDSLSLMDLKELAKTKGIKSVSKMKKDELIEAILAITDNKNEKISDNENIDNTNDNTYSVSVEGDEITEGILEILPDGYGYHGD